MYIFKTGHKYVYLLYKKGNLCGTILSCGFNKRVVLVSIYSIWCMWDQFKQTKSTVSMFIIMQEQDIIKYNI